MRPPSLRHVYTHIRIHTHTYIHTHTRAKLYSTYITTTPQQALVRQSHLNTHTHPCTSALRVQRPSPNPQSSVPQPDTTVPLPGPLTNPNPAPHSARRRTKSLRPPRTSPGAKCRHHTNTGIRLPRTNAGEPAQAHPTPHQSPRPPHPRLQSTHSWSGLGAPTQPTPGTSQPQPRSRDSVSTPQDTSAL